jgi:hypothetical protein
MNDSKAVPTPPPPHPHIQRHPKWERQLPKCYVMASILSLKSFKLDVALQTTNTGEVFASKGLHYCGATVRETLEEALRTTQTHTNTSEHTLDS